VHKPYWAALVVDAESGREKGSGGGLKEGLGERGEVGMRIGSSIGCVVRLEMRAMNKCVRGENDGTYRFRVQEGPTPARRDRRANTL
jgi:hypothetical protein